MSQVIKIGVVCLARKTFDHLEAANIYKRLQNELKSIKNIEWVFIDDLVIEIKDAQNAAHICASKEIDGLVCISGTFALGHLVLELYKTVTKPILLWGLNELPYDGGKIRLNSVCGINLNASNLYKAGIKNYHIIIGDRIDLNWLDAIRIIKSFKSSHIGIIGFRAKGFFNLDVDELDLFKETGILIDHFELNNIIDFHVEDNEINERKMQIKSIFDVSEISNDQLGKVAALTVKFDNFIKNYNLDAIAIRCWPEFASNFGISPCATMSLLQSEGKILACEGDILGSLSMLAHKAIGGRTPFLADFSQIDFSENFGLLWHCGVAACNLWDEKCLRSLDSYFAEGKGVTADFVMKSGDLSLLRIDYASGEYRIFLQDAKGIPMKKELKGTYVKAEFKEGVKNIFDKIVENGIAHHISVVYGNFIKPFEIFAKIKGWKVIK
ncbi:MAG: fucose isomerase [Candidatus Lokiarchaeota archaeon]|nr:fucose isomerase [Candidatus Lokiarchaeota archaeon]